MLTDADLEYSREKDLDNSGAALVWIIDGQCLYDLPLIKEHVDMFTMADEVRDVSYHYPEHIGMTVMFLKDKHRIGQLQTSEYFASILLSNPLVLNLEKYPYGRYVQSPYATFDGERFHITNRDVTGLDPWHSINRPKGE